MARVLPGTAPQADRSASNPSRALLRAQPGAVAQTARLLGGLYFLAMALGVNLFSTLREGASAYTGMADLAMLRPYKWLLRDVIPPVAMPFTLLLIAFELAVGLLILGTGRAVKLGLLAAIVFQLTIIPGLGAYGLVNLPVAAIQAWLLRKNFDRSALDLVRDRLRDDRTPQAR
jgi:hypothetical protein